MTSCGFKPLADLGLWRSLTPPLGRIVLSFTLFAEDGDRVTVPIGLQVNHRYIGGRALGELVEAVALHYSRPD